VAHKPLHILAEDPSDLEIISAAAQDAIFRVGDGVWLPGPRRFTLKVQRFVWESPDPRGKGERVWAALSFDSILSARAHKIAQSRRDAFASLLSLSFEPGESPGGTITLNFADGGAIALEAECIDALLADIGEAREAVARPTH
jgi:hypothetical protein